MRDDCGPPSSDTTGVSCKEGSSFSSHVHCSLSCSTRGSKNVIKTLVADKESGVAHAGLAGTKIDGA